MNIDRGRERSAGLGLSSRGSSLELAVDHVYVDEAGDVQGLGLVAPPRRATRP